MTIARRQLVCAQTTPYYHLIARCVRRGFLCGFDRYSGNDYEHRRQWVIDRLSQLSEVFAIEVLAYAVMSNHYHLVIRLQPQRAQRWDPDEVIQRWSTLYGLPPALAPDQRGAGTSAQQAAAGQLIETRRQRLASVSWFMKCLNEPIARRANREDRCTGAFWEGRFKSRALLNERALLSCMAYVDLNPVRAGVARSPESSDYTSVQARIRRQSPVKLASFRDAVSAQRGATPIPASLAEYLTLVDLTGRSCAAEHPEPIDGARATLLDRLGMDGDRWRRAVNAHRGPYHVLGAPEQVRAAAKRFAKKWFRGISHMGMFAKK